MLRGDRAGGGLATGHLPPPKDRPHFVADRPYKPLAWEPKLGFDGAGVYEATKPIQQIAAGSLVMAEQDELGKIRILEPSDNIRNVWEFAGPGIEAGPGDLAVLEKLPYEGFYVLRHGLRFKGEEPDAEPGYWVDGAIVQLGYSASAEPILFLAQLGNDGENATLWFSKSGVQLEQSQLAELWPLAWYQADAAR